MGRGSDFHSEEGKALTVAAHAHTQANMHAHPHTHTHTHTHRNTCTHSGINASLLPIGCQILTARHAFGIGFLRLERMESDLRGVLAFVPAIGRVAVGFNQKVPIVVAGNLEVALHALVDEHVLPPETIARTELPEVVDTTLPASVPHLYRLSREDFEWSVKPSPAVVQVEALGVVFDRVVHENFPKPGGEEDAVRVHLHCPGMQPESTLLHNLVPDCEENVIVQGRLELTAIFAVKIDVNYMCVELL
mmetsp:Transcript_14512/g.31424  ORF Transcript_14512/g.31424 Transcript_14512/m.31424 type:complete len:248 (+) Transcript_14512:290-1033(+)